MLKSSTNIFFPMMSNGLCLMFLSRRFTSHPKKTKSLVPTGNCSSQLLWCKFGKSSLYCWFVLANFCSVNGGKRSEHHHEQFFQKFASLLNVARPMKRKHGVDVSNFAQGLKIDRSSAVTGEELTLNVHHAALGEVDDLRVSFHARRNSCPASSKNFLKV